MQSNVHVRQRDKAALYDQVSKIRLHTSLEALAPQQHQLIDSYALSHMHLQNQVHELFMHALTRPPHTTPAAHI
jgi:hypothetical protein